MKRAGRAASALRSLCSFVLLAIAAPGCLDSLNLDGSSGGATQPGVAPDPSYKAEVGDRAVLFGTEPDASGEMVPLFPDVTAFDKYERAVKQSDTAQLSDMEREGLLSRTSNGTRVAVLSLADRTHIGDRFAAQVRVLDGPLKDTTAWTPAVLVTRLVRVDPQN